MECSDRISLAEDEELSGPPGSEWKAPLERNSGSLLTATQTSWGGQRQFQLLYVRIHGVTA